MTPMLEKVSRAICEASGQSWDDSSDGYLEICEGFAIAAVRALREPTPEMIDAADSKVPADSDNLQCPDWYTAAIDSILADTGDGE